MSCPTANMIPRDTLLCGTGIVMTMAFLAFATQLSAQTYLDPVHSGNNDGSVGMPWRWNETSANRIEIVDGTALTILINGAWDQFIDTPHNLDLTGRNLALLFVFRKNGAGDVALGFARDMLWGAATSTSHQQFFKIKGNHVFISQDHQSSVTDEDTGATIIPNAPQGLMMKISSSGSVHYFYQNGAGKDVENDGWLEITPAASPAGNLDHFDPTLKLIGVNACGAGGGALTLDYVGLFEIGPLGTSVGKNAVKRWPRYSQKEGGKIQSSSDFKNPADVQRPLPMVAFQRQTIKSLVTSILQHAFTSNGCAWRPSHN